MDSEPSSYTDETTFFRIDPSINPTDTYLGGGSEITNSNSWNSESGRLLVSSQITNQQKDEKNFEESEIIDDPSKRNGTVMSAVFNISNGVMGAGILSFPYAMYCVGVVGGILGLFMITFLIFSTLYVNMRCSFMIKGGHRTYQSMIKRYLGSIFMKINEFCQFIAVFGSCVAYISIIGDYCQTFLIEIFGIEITNEWYGNKKVIILFFVIVFLFPLCSLRQVKSLQFTSLLAVVAIGYLTILIICTGISNIVAGNSIFNSKKKMINGIQWFIQDQTSKDLNFPVFFLGFPIILFGQTCHSMMFPVSYEIRGASQRKIWTAILPAFIVIVILYLLVETMGFFQFGNNVNPNILDNYSSRNVFASIARFLIGINVVFTYPVLAYVGRLVITSLIFFFFPSYSKKRKKENGELGTVLHLTVTTAYVFATVILALFVPGIDVAFSLTGSIGCSSTVFLFPSILCFYQIGLKSYSSRNPCRYIHIALSCLFFCSYLFFLIFGSAASIFKVFTK